jgi:hypothetical protein
LAIGLAPAGLSTGCAPESTGTLALSFTLATEDSAGLTELRVEPAWGGVNRGPERDADWQRVPAVPPDGPLPVPGEGGGVLVARGAVPAGAYDRVFVATPRVTARAPSGQVVEVVSHIEPTVRPVAVTAGGEVAVDIELVVRPLPSWRSPGWAVFVKGARLP